MKKLGETLLIMRALFSGDRVTFDGNYYKVRGASLYPMPEKPPPILVAAARPRAVAQAGQYADIVALGTRSREFLAQQIEWLHAAAGERFEKLEIACYTLVMPESSHVDSGRTAWCRVSS